MSKQVMIHKEPRILSEKFKEVNSMFIVGVDIAKRSHEAIVIDDSGSIVKKHSTSKTTPQGSGN